MTEETFQDAELIITDFGCDAIAQITGIVHLTLLTLNMHAFRQK